METLQHLIPLVFTVSLAAMVAAIGMDSSLDELLSLFRRPWFLLKAIVAVNVIVPVAAAAMIALFPLSPVARVGIMLMAVSPVPPLAPGKQLKAGGSKAFSYGLYTALILLAVVIVPITVAFVADLYGVGVSLKPLAVFENVAISVVAPLAVGLVIRQFAPGPAERLGPIISKVAMVLLLLAVIPMLVVAWPHIAALVGNGTFLAMAIVAAVALLGGHLLGGPNREDRGALAMASVTRHPGIALMLANATGADKRVTAAILAFMLVGIVVGLPYQTWQKRRASAAPVAALG